MTIKLFMNQTKTYPNVSYPFYDPAYVIEVLKKAGVAEFGEVSRQETVPSGNIFAGPRVITYREVWFDVPEDRDIARRLEDQLQKLYPGRMLVDWHPNAGLVWAAAQRLAGRLDVSIEDGAILVDTRDGGDVGDGVPGKEDVQAMHKFVEAMKIAVPGIMHNAGNSGEWVYCSFAFAEMDSLAKPVAGMKP